MFRNLLLCSVSIQWFGDLFIEFLGIGALCGLCCLLHVRWWPGLLYILFTISIQDMLDVRSACTLVDVNVMNVHCVLFF